MPTSTRYICSARFVANRGFQETSLDAKIAGKKVIYGEKVNYPLAIPLLIARATRIAGYCVSDTECSEGSLKKIQESCFKL